MNTPIVIGKDTWAETGVKHWHNMKDKHPAEGQCVVMLFTNGEKNKDFWTTDIGYYCDNGFYKLDYDPYTGVMKKIYVTEPVSYWCSWVYFPLSEIN